MKKIIANETSVNRIWTVGIPSRNMASACRVVVDGVYVEGSREMNGKFPDQKQIKSIVNYDSLFISTEINSVTKILKIPSEDDTIGSSSAMPMSMLLDSEESKKI